MSDRLAAACGFLVGVGQDLSVVATCERCGCDVDTAATEWPELDAALRQRMQHLSWAWANVGPNLANHAAKCVGWTHPDDERR